MTAPESQPLTDQDASAIRSDTLAHPDSGRPFCRSCCDNVIRLLDVRADLRDRLRAAEGERDEALRNTAPPMSVLAEIEERRADEAFMQRVRDRVATDADLLQRIGDDELLIADLRARCAHMEATAEADKARAVAEALREHEAMRLARVDAHVAEIQNEALTPVLALVEKLDADLASAAPSQFSIGLMRGRLKTIREAVSGRG